MKYTVFSPYHVTDVFPPCINTVHHQNDQHFQETSWYYLCIMHFLCGHFSVEQYTEMMSHTYVQIN